MTETTAKYLCLVCLIMSIIYATQGLLLLIRYPEKYDYRGGEEPVSNFAFNSLKICIMFWILMFIFRAQFKAW